MHSEAPRMLPLRAFGETRTSPLKAHPSPQLSPQDVARILSRPVHFTRMSTATEDSRLYGV